MKKIVIILFILLTSSCSVSIVHERVTIKELLPIGSTLQLTRSINIPADRSYMYIADGKVAPLKNYNTVSIYEPYCMFGFDKESPYARQIMPDTFKVTRIVEWEGYYSSIDTGKKELAFRRKGELIKTVSFFNGDNSPGNIMYATIISLQSDKQPNVKKIVCGHWDEYGVVEPLTLKELKTALGELIIINKNVITALWLE